MSPPDSALADPQQIIADLQRANAELQRRLDESNAETREALEQQTATAEVLQVINELPGDLAPVFEAMLEKALRLCDASFGTFATFDGVGFRAVARLGYDPGPDRSHRTIPTPGMAYYRLIHDESIVHVTDITDDEVYRSGDPERRRFANRTGARTAIWVALKSDAALLGAFVIYRTEVQPFSDKQIALLQNFGAQAVVAMENARLITETREALEQQTATSEVLQVINCSPGDLAPVFEAMVQKAIRLCDAVSGTLWTYDGKRFVPAAVSGQSRLAEPFQRHDPTGAAPDTPGGRLLGGEHVVHILDARRDPAYQTRVRYREMVDIEDCRTFVAVGLRKDGALLGMISAYRQEVRPFTDKQIALLQNFAAQAVIAMENARLITETREALEQQTATAEVLGVINSSPGDLAPVFDAMLEKAMRLCEAAFGASYAYDGELFRATAFRGMPPALVEFFRQPFRAGRGFATGRLADGESIVHIADIAAHEPSPGNRATAELGGGRTVVWVALRKEETLLGFICMYRQEVRPFRL